MHQHMRLQSNGFFSDDITHLNHLYLFCHFARAFPEDDRLRALLAAMRKLAAGWKLRKGRPKTTRIRSEKNDFAPMNIGLNWYLRKAQDRTGWRRLGM